MHVGRERPDVVVLAGPFVDTHHPTVARGACALESDDGDAEEVVNGVPRASIDLSAAACAPVPARWLHFAAVARREVSLNATRHRLSLRDDTCHLYRVEADFRAWSAAVMTRRASSSLLSSPNFRRDFHMLL